MAVTTIGLIAERWLDEVFMGVNVADVTGAAFYLESFRLPAGMTDVAILNVEVTGYSLATRSVVAGIGSHVDVRSQDGATIVDIVGDAPFYGTSGDELRAFHDPDALVLWRQGELLTAIGPELDTNGAPTGDFGIKVKAVRVRPIESAARGPVRLVR